MADSHVPDETATSYDVDGASQRIGASLFGESHADSSEPNTPNESNREHVPTSTQSSTPTPIDVPKSWKQDMHPYWGKMDRKVQEYYIEREKQMLDGLEQYKQGAQYAKPFMDVLQPYQHLFTERKPHEMVSSLLRAHQLLTNGTAEERRRHYEELGRNLKLIAEQPDAQGQNGTAVSPEITSLNQEISSIKEYMRQQQEAMYQSAFQESQKVVEQFAADTKAHPYFAEVEGDILKLMRLNTGISLQEAYDAAVSLNPAVRAKEQARLLTEHEAKLKENARLASLPKKVASGVNVKGQDSGRTPTEPVGSMRDTIRDTIRAIHERAS